MKKIVCLIVLAGLIFGINSCKEEVIIEKVITEPETNLNFSIEDAKAWMEFDYQTELNFKSAGKIKKKYKLSQLWKKARRFENDKVVAVEIPLSSVDKFGFLTAETEELMRNTGIFDYALSETSLLIQKNKETGLVTAHFMTIVGDPVYLDKTDFKVNTNKFLKKDKDFSGMVLFHNLRGIFNIGWKYYEGVLTHRISGNTLIESGLRLKGAQTEVVCYHMEIYEIITYYTEYESGAIHVTSIETNVIDSYDVCTYSEGGGGTAPGAPVAEADPQDCNCETCPVCHKCLPILLKGATVLLPDEDEGTSGTTTSTDETLSNCPMCNCDCNFAFSIGIDCDVLLNFEQDYRNSMSEMEKNLFDGMNRVQQLSYLANAQFATWEASARYPNSIYNGKGDAFRHAYWNALNVIDLGLGLAGELSTAHEEKDSNYLYNYKENEMDLFNNNVGRGLTVANECYSVLDCVQNALENGSLRYLNNLDYNGRATSSSQLVPTNQ